MSLLGYSSRLQLHSTESSLESDQAMTPRPSSSELPTPIMSEFPPSTLLLNPGLPNDIDSLFALAPLTPAATEPDSPLPAPLPISHSSAAAGTAHGNYHQQLDDFTGIRKGSGSSNGNANNGYSNNNNNGQDRYHIVGSAMADYADYSDQETVRPSTASRHSIPAHDLNEQQHSTAGAQVNQIPPHSYLVTAASLPAILGRKENQKDIDQVMTLGIEDNGEGAEPPMATPLDIDDLLQLADELGIPSTDKTNGSEMDPGGATTRIGLTGDDHAHSSGINTEGCEAEAEGGGGSNMKNVEINPRGSRSQRPKSMPAAIPFVRSWTNPILRHSQDIDEILATADRAESQEKENPLRRRSWFTMKKNTSFLKMIIGEGPDVKMNFEAVQNMQPRPDFEQN